MADYVPKRYRNLPLPQQMKKAQRQVQRTWHWVKFSGYYNPTILESWKSVEGVFTKYIKDTLSAAGYVPKSDFHISKQYKSTHRDGSVSYTKDKHDAIMESVMRRLNGGGEGIELPTDIVHQDTRYEFTVAFNSSVQVEELDFLFTMALPCKIVEDTWYAGFGIPSPKKYKEVNFSAESVGVPTPKKPKITPALSTIVLDSGFPSLSFQQSIGRMARNQGKTQSVITFIDGLSTVHRANFKVLKGRGTLGGTP